MEERNTRADIYGQETSSSEAIGSKPCARGGNTITKILGLMLRLARVHFLFLGFMLYLMGYLLAVLGEVGFDLGKFVSGYLILGLAQLSVSFSNDYFDRYSDRGATKTAF